MPAFDEVQFPTGISYGVTGGPRRRTEIATLASGAEERNVLWADSRREYNAGYGIRSHDDLHAVLAFFEARLGQARAFRFRDWADYKSGPPLQAHAPTDQVLGTGTGAQSVFQLVKVYASGPQSWTRVVKKPVAGTVRLAVGGAEKVLGSDFTVDTTTGVVTFLPGRVPGAGAAVTAGFQFDVPVRFATDFLSVNLSQFEAGEIPDIPLIEVRI
ncbi:TIGR02217 family protein [Rhodoplanes sp. SY1]|uniref:phage distal tail protein, Rcc01695 family n=1 Tax=Rhodoplanes sp. SY1 TaxID=3166646 RepID=UPI0038B5AD74